jgi:hypothetical protein
MQRHGQTVFMLEQLQPSWLASTHERVAYTLGSRLIVGLLYGLIFGTVFWAYWPDAVVLIGTVLFGFLFGLAVGLQDVNRLLREAPRGVLTIPTIGQRLRSILMDTGVLLIVYIVGSNALWIAMGFYLPSTASPNEMVPVVVAMFMSLFLFLPAFSITWGRRNSRRTPGRDIQCVETLTWSWKAGAMGCLPLVVLGITLGLVIGASLGGAHVDVMVPAAAMGVLLAAVPALPLGVIAGLRTGVQDMKSLPNQGIRLSMRCAICGGLSVGLMLSLVLWPIASVFRHTSQLTNPLPLPGRNPVWAGLGDGLVCGLVFALIVGSALFGGLDVLLHYFLRLMLSMKGRTPLNLVRFLDYSAKDLNFLQKVGGGYIFIHRMLLEHFAAMEVGEKSNPQEAPAPSAPKPPEPLAPTLM